MKKNVLGLLRKVRRRRVQYFEIGDEVSVEGVICQAAHAIDVAATLAAREKNSERMLQTAEHWTKLADFIMAVSEHQDKKRDKKSEVRMGFQSTPSDDEEKQEIEKDEDVRSDED